MAIQPLSDEKDLLKRLREGDQTAFSVIFLTYYPGLCVFAEKYVGKGNAEDVVEEVFLKLLQSGIAFNDSHHLKAYLYRAVKHACLDTLKIFRRAGERQMTYATTYNEPQSAYLAHIMQTEAMRILHQALDTLPPQVAQVIRMTYLDGMTNQEAADELDVSVNTVKTQKQRGLNKLRRILPRDQFGILLILFFA